MAGALAEAGAGEEAAGVNSRTLSIGEGIARDISRAVLR